MEALMLRSTLRMMKICRLLIKLHVEIRCMKWLGWPPVQNVYTLIFSLCQCFIGWFFFLLWLPSRGTVVFQLHENLVAMLDLI